jgi:hypothetical protein
MRHKVTVNGFGLREVNQIVFGTVPGTIQDPSDKAVDGFTIKVLPPPGAAPGNGLGWVDVTASLEVNDSSHPILQSTIHDWDRFAFYKAGIPVMRPALDRWECNPAMLFAVIWDEAGDPVTDSAIASKIRFRTNRGSFDQHTQVEFTPTTLGGNEALAILFEGGPGSLIYEPSVGLDGQDQFRSSRQVNFSDVQCAIMRTERNIQSDVVSAMNLRDQLKIQFNPPIPRDKFSAVARPLQATITTAAAVSKSSKFSHQVSVTVRDANGNPVAGLPVAVIPVTGKVARTSPVITNKKGEVHIGLAVSKEGRARVTAVVDEVPSVLVAAIEPAMVRKRKAGH